MFIINLNRWDLDLELKILYNTLKEIAAENNIIDYRQTADEFFESLEITYDVKIRLTVQKKQNQQKKYNDTKPDNPIGTFPFYSEIKPFTTLPKPAVLVEKQQEQQQMPWPSSISFSYRKFSTTASNRKEEQNNHLNNNYQPTEWYRSDYDNNNFL